MPARRAGRRTGALPTLSRALGCARLDGRVGLRRSARLLETALDLGITYFDVAPRYGTAEEALGQVIGSSGDVVIATKVGPPPVPYSTTKMRLKSVVKPVLDRLRGVKMLLRRTAAPPPAAPSSRPRYDFSTEAIERSLAGLAGSGAGLLKRV